MDEYVSAAIDGLDTIGEFVWACLPPLVLLVLAAVLALFTPIWATIPLVVFTVVMVADARARWLEYGNLCRAIRGGVSPLINAMVLRRSGSWCQRHAAEAACWRCGRPGLATNWYRRQGYRWYHIFPDGAFQRDSAFLKPTFWRSVLGLQLRG